MELYSVRKMDKLLTLECRHKHSILYSSIVRPRVPKAATSRVRLSGHHTTVFILIKYTRTWRLEVNSETFGGTIFTNNIIKVDSGNISIKSMRSNVTQSTTNFESSGNFNNEWGLPSHQLGQEHLLLNYSLFLWTLLFSESSSSSLVSSLLQTL